MHYFLKKYKLEEQKIAIETRKFYDWARLQTVS